MKWQFVPIMTTFLFIALFIAIVTTTVFASPNSCYVDFERWNSTISYSHSMASKDFGSNCFNWNSSNNSKLTISDNKNLTAILLKGKNGKTEGGIAFNVKFEPALEYILEFDLLFEKDFEWQLGGYLPGIGTGNLKDTRNPLYFACPMWNSKGQLSSSLQTDTNNKTNQVTSSTYTLITDTWIHVKERFVSNLSLSNDGSFDLYIDEKLVLAKQNVQWTKDIGKKADNLIFVAGFDSMLPNNVPSKDIKIRFDNVTMNKIR